MSERLRTHYDNLMVSRNAPPEVIAAAYKALSKQFHPDLHPNDPRAAKIMRIVNASYSVLSDPIKRQKHDEWISQQEFPNASPIPKRSQETIGYRHPFKKLAAHFRDFWSVYLIIGSIAACSFSDSKSSKPSGLPEYVAEPSSEIAQGQDNTPKYMRPLTAPNGSEWPNKAAYVEKYPIARADGRSQITIDNGSNDTDMFVKLVALDANRTMPVRHAYIPARTSFTMNKVDSGEYDIRYMDLSDGSLSRSEAFEMQEVQELGGVRYSIMEMTLYKVNNGNMQTYPLSPAEF